MILIRLDCDFQTLTQYDCYDALSKDTLESDEKIMNMIKKKYVIYASP